MFLLFSAPNCCSLKALCSHDCRFGEIESIRVLHDRFCAFINFKNANMAARALEKLQVRVMSHSPFRREAKFDAVSFRSGGGAGEQQAGDEVPGPLDPAHPDPGAKGQRQPWLQHRRDTAGLSSLRVPSIIRNSSVCLALCFVLRVLTCFVSCVQTWRMSKKMVRPIRVILEKGRNAGIFL